MHWQPIGDVWLPMRVMHTCIQGSIGNQLAISGCQCVPCIHAHREALYRLCALHSRMIQGVIHAHMFGSRPWLAACDKRTTLQTSVVGNGLDFCMLFRGLKYSMPRLSKSLASCSTLSSSTKAASHCSTPVTQSLNRPGNPECPYPHMFVYAFAAGMTSARHIGTRARGEWMTL